MSIFRQISRVLSISGFGFVTLASIAAQAAVVDIYRERSYGSEFGEVSTIQTTASAEDYYDYYSFSGHPVGVNTFIYGSGVWVQENPVSGAYSFGFISGRDNSGVSSSFSIRVSVRNSLTNTSIAVGDESHEFKKVGADSYLGDFKNRNNSDGFMIEGITGTDWVIEFEVLSRQGLKAFHAYGDDGRTGLWYEGVYELTLNGNNFWSTPSLITGGDITECQDQCDQNNNNENNNNENIEVAEIPEPAGLALMGIGLLAIGGVVRRKR